MRADFKLFDEPAATGSMRRIQDGRFVFPDVACPGWAGTSSSMPGRPSSTSLSTAGGARASTSSSQRWCRLGYHVFAKKSHVYLCRSLARRGRTGPLDLSITKS